MGMKLSHCSQFVRDQDEALAFYRDVIGLEVRLDVPMPMGDARWLTMGPPGQPDIEIMIEKPFHIEDPGDKKTLFALMAKHVLQTLIFVTDDCDAAFARVRSAGGTVAQEPTDQPYGFRDCAFRDPTGNQVRFSQPLGS